MVSIDNLKYREYSVHEIYRKSVVDIPTGYEFVDFCPPQDGDKFLSNGNTNNVLTASGFWRLKNQPRIIVRQITTIEETPMTSYKKCFTKIWTVKEIYGVEDPVIPEGYEVTEFRFVEFGETFLELNRKPSVSTPTFESQIPKLILRKKKKLYAKIPVISFIREEASTYVQFKDVADVYWRINLNKDVEIIEE